MMWIETIYPSVLVEAVGNGLVCKKGNTSMLHTAR